MVQKRISGVSVIISFCCERYGQLNELLKSIENQTLKPLEVIIVVDGLNWFDSEKIVTCCFETRIFELEKKGRPAPLRNYGIKQSRGEFLAFSDDDDVWHERKLQLQMSYLMRVSTTDILFSERTFFHNNYDSHSSLNHTERVSKVKLFPLMIRNSLCFSSIMIRFNSAILFNEDEELKAWEDWEYYLRALNKGMRLELQRIKLLGYREHVGSIRNGFVVKMLQNQKEFFRKSNFWTEKYLLTNLLLLKLNYAKIFNR